MTLEASLNQVLQVSRNSGLHFSAQETPYSLYISIRKKFKEDREAPAQFVPISSSNQDEKITDLTKECKLLGNALEQAKNELIQEIDEHAKTVKEKDVIGRQLVSQESLNKNLRQEIEGLKADLSTLESDLKGMKKINKIKEKELHDINKENKTLRENFQASNRDLKILKAQVKKNEKDGLKKSNVSQVKEPQNNREFACEVCPQKFESSVKLNVHIKLDHFKANSTQTDEIFGETKSAQTRKDILIDKTIQTQPSAADAGEILRKVECNEYEKYKCFYCEKVIETEQHLLEHRESCHGATDTPSLFSFPVRPRPLLFKCGICGLVASYKEVIVTHKKRKHKNQ